MIVELRSRLGSELDRASRELTSLATTTQSDAEAARHARRVLERRIRFLGQLVAGLVCVQARDIAPERAGYGSVVRVRDLGAGDEGSYVLMSGDFIDLDEGQISLASPLGQAVLGRNAGERVTVATPRGERRLEVLSVTTLPQRLGIRSTTGAAAPASQEALQLA